MSILARTARKQRQCGRARILRQHGVRSGYARHKYPLAETRRGATGAIVSHPNVCCSMTTAMRIRQVDQMIDSKNLHPVMTQHNGSCHTLEYQPGSAPAWAFSEETQYTKAFPCHVYMLQNCRLVVIRYKDNHEIQNDAGNHHGVFDAC